MDISVVGLGKLGLCTAACLAASGHTVVGYDNNEEHRVRLKSGGLIEETGLKELMPSARKNLRFVDSYQEAAAGSEIVMLIVPTPSLADGRFSNDSVVAAIEGLAPALKSRSGFFIVDIVSTVMPGACEALFKPLLEKLTGKRCGRDFGLVYNPEFIALGSVIQNFLYPDLVLIGASDPRSAADMTRVYRQTCKSSPVISTMSLINAEITKLSLNCYVTMKISFANRLAAICEGVPGADIDVITGAMGADSRIGHQGLKGGIGFGGPCFPRDNVAFQAFADDVSCDAILSKAVVAVNDEIPNRLVGTISRHCAPGARIALLGLAYKPGTHIIENSHSIVLAGRLSGAGYRVTVHDPKALGSARTELGAAVQYAHDPYQCVAGCSAVVLLTDWPEYRDIDWCRISDQMQPAALLIDSWRVARGKAPGSFIYRPVGIGID